jgi:hypothetical protein
MSSPFPGMDPFLERPSIFPDFHDAFVSELRNEIARILPPPYFAGLRSRNWVEEASRPVFPDVSVFRSTDSGTAVAIEEPAVETEVRPVTVLLDEISESYIEIRYAPDGERLVTSIELLSPANKTPGAQGQDLYLQKQQEVLASDVSLIEIDLLRGGSHTTAIVLQKLRESVGASTYHIRLRRADQRFRRTIYPIQLWNRLPQLEVPLLPEHGSVTVALQPAMNRCYELGRYHLRAKYREPVPAPALRPGEAAYVARCLAAVPPASTPVENRNGNTDS